MRPGRLVLLSDYFGADGAATGGAGVAALQSFEILGDLGARVELVSGYFTPEALRGRPDVRVLGGEDLRARGSAASAVQAIHNGEAKRRLAPVLAGLDPHNTVIVLHQWTRWLSPSALGLMKPFKLMIYMHDYFWLCPNGAYYDFQAGAPCSRTPMGPGCLAAACDRAGYGMKLARVARHTMKALAAGGDPADRVLLHVSGASRSLGAGLAPQERHAVVRNPLPPHALARRGPPGPPLYDVGYFGRLEPEKGVADLAEAARRTGLKCIFVGSGSLASDLRVRLGPDAVLDWADPEDALELMQRCRVVALPSRWRETWGLVVAEALALARPVVVSDRAGSASLVRRFGGGEVFDPGAPGALEKALQAVLRRGRDALAMDRVAQAVRRFLAPSVHGRQILDLARELWDLDLLASGPEAEQPPSSPAQLSSLLKGALSA